eukprot:260-Heterococcus_DN1.PRE.1
MASAGRHRACSSIWQRTTAAVVVSKHGNGAHQCSTVTLVHSLTVQALRTVRTAIESAPCNVRQQLACHSTVVFSHVGLILCLQTALYVKSSYASSNAALKGRDSQF